MSATKRKREHLEANSAANTSSGPATTALARVQQLVDQMGTGNEEEWKTKALLLLIDVKKHLRERFVAAKAAADGTDAERQKMDVLLLQLQNRLYEKEHLHGEIHKCKMFRTTRVEAINPALAQTATGANESHAAVLQALQEEHALRKEKAAALDALKKQREILLQANQELQRKLESQPAIVKSLHSSLTEARRVFDIEDGSLLSGASSLDRPLYLLHSQLLANAKVYGNVEGLTIVPTPRLATNLAAADPLERNGAIGFAVRTTTHTVHFEVSYLPTLEIVAIKSRLSGPPLCLDLLQGLASGDAGLTMPSALAAARAEQHGVLDMAALHARHGFPYRWLHTLCGLPATLDHPSPIISIASFVDAINARIVALSAAAAQLATLAERSLPLDTSIEATRVFPLQGIATIGNWREQPGGASERTFDCALQRTYDDQGTKRVVDLIASITMPIAFPTVTPRVVLRTGAHNNTSIEDSLEDITAEVSTHASELPGHGKGTIVGSIVRRLQMCVDLFVLTETHETHPLFVRGIIGRERARPFYFNVASGKFEHRS